jgi:hypothetical protein
MFHLKQLFSPFGEIMKLSELMLVHKFMNDAMHTKQIAEYRAAAAACVKWAEAKDVNEGTSRRWRKLAYDWTQFADEIERKLTAGAGPDGTKP